MRKIFFVLLMAFSCSLWAEWEFLGETDSSSFFFDAASIKKEGEIRRVWAVSNTNIKDKGASERHLLEYNCKKEQVRFLSRTKFSEPMALGEALEVGNDISNWIYVAPRTVHESLLKRVCAM
jgi:hypothetical protein